MPWVVLCNGLLLCFVSVHSLVAPMNK
jgi:hypothetical protein